MRTILITLGLALTAALWFTPSHAASPDGDAVVWAFGDACTASATKNDCTKVAALAANDPTTDAVLVLGDAQYDVGSLAQYTNYWDPKMAAIGPLVIPAPGNHDYRTTGAAGFFDYWGARAGTRGQGWHAQDIGSWTIVALNTNCSYVGGCAPTSPQGKFVATATAGGPMCELVFAHHPFITDGRYAPGTRQGKMAFTLAYNNGADLYLSGHDHSYQRFAPTTPDGTPSATGTRPIVVGTGGNNLVGFGSTNRSEYRQASTFGALRLVLSPTGYTGEYVAVGGTVMDTFAGSCH